jgi:hypothetical protein
MDFRTVTRYPTYAISNSARIINKRSFKEVKLLKGNDANGLARVSLQKDGKKVKETVQNLLQEEFQIWEIIDRDDEPEGLEVWIDGILIAESNERRF